MGALQDSFIASARRQPQATAVVEPGKGSITYGDLNVLSDRLRDRLASLGVGPGDRVGFYVRKSIDSVATILGTLKTGAAYVPVDPNAPAARGAYILHNCAVKVVVVEAALAEKLAAELAALSATPSMLQVDGRKDAGAGLREALDTADRAGLVAPPIATATSNPKDLAYILYTSGSTGKPKGVMLSHENAVGFIDWCSEVFMPTAADRFSSHAPFHFDLSILDIHVCLKHGATLVLIGEDLGKDAPRLAQLIADERISIWYSAPSILALLAQYGNLASRDYSHLKQVLFAGEVFAVKHLRTLCELLPKPRYYNLYGPTETNVCTWHPIPDVVEAERSAPYPIGTTCSHFRYRVVDEDGRDVPRGSEGELVMHGTGMLQGYYNNPARTAAAFLVDGDGRRWYRTGDLVVEGADGVFGFSGRRDRMVKRRGYRIELGEIEAGLYRHEGVKEAAVVALKDAEGGVRIKAFVAMAEGQRGSVIAIRAFCAKTLPNYMIPDAFGFLEGLPKTSTDKVDYVRLAQAG
jgi:amino acid adenylation domain-containing protein